MRVRLSLALYSDHLTLRAEGVRAEYGLLANVRTLGKRLFHSSKAARPSPRCDAVETKQPISRPLGDHALLLELQQTWSSLRKELTDPFETVDFSVQLGLGYTRLGVLHLVQSNANKLAPDIVQRYIEVWLKQAFDVDAASQLIRWQAVADDRVVVSCIERSIFDQLTEFAGQQRMRFVSCTPAALQAIGIELESSAVVHGNQRKEDAGDVVVIWSEPSITTTRGSLVQMAHLSGTQPQSLWRGWLPVATTSDGFDEALYGGLRRFLAARTLPSETNIVWANNA